MLFCGRFGVGCGVGMSWWVWGRVWAVCGPCVAFEWFVVVGGGLGCFDFWGSVRVLALRFVRIMGDVSRGGLWLLINFFLLLCAHEVRGQSAHEMRRQCARDAQTLVLVFGACGVDFAD